MYEKTNRFLNISDVQCFSVGKVLWHRKKTVTMSQHAICWDVTCWLILWSSRSKMLASAFVYRCCRIFSFIWLSILVSYGLSNGRLSGKSINISDVRQILSSVSIDVCSNFTPWVDKSFSLFFFAIQKEKANGNAELNASACTTQEPVGEHEPRNIRLRAFWYFLSDFGDLRLYIYKMWTDVWHFQISNRSRHDNV